MINFYVLGRFSNNPELRKKGDEIVIKEGLIFKSMAIRQLF